MAKLESTFKNMVISLLGITFVASASLGLVNDATKMAISQAEQNVQAKAITSVLPKFDKHGTSYKVLPIDGRDSVEVYPALDANGNVIANAVKTYSYNGFNGYIEVMVGFDNKGVVSGYQVLKHGETPGLGTKMKNWFNNSAKQNQYVIGRTPSQMKLTVKKDGGEIDAITAATISSRAFLESINRASAVIKKEEVNTQN